MKKVLFSSLALLAVVSGQSCTESFGCQGESLVDDVTCLGYFGCYGADIDAVSVACTGAYGCYGATIESDTTAICNGAYACRDASKIVAESYIFCDGYYSCKDVPNIQSDAYVYCDGDYSCGSSNVEAETYAYCNGNYGCYDATVAAGDYVYCDGESSCAHATITSTDEIYCFGTEGCEYASLAAVMLITIDGRRAAAYATITTAMEVVTRGYFSTAFATIDSVGVPYMTVQAIGYFSGYGATFICRSGSVCKLVCCSNACEDMSFICADGATCSVSECDDCASSPTQTFLSLTTDEDNDKLKKLLSTRKEEKEKNLQYLEIKNQILYDIKVTEAHETSVALSSLGISTKVNEGNDDDNYYYDNDEEEVNADGKKDDDKEESLLTAKLKDQVLALQSTSTGIGSMRQHRNTYYGLIIAMISSIMTGLMVYACTHSKMKNMAYQSIPN